MFNIWNYYLALVCSLSGLLCSVTAASKSPHYATTSSVQYTNDAGVGNHASSLASCDYSTLGINPCEGPGPAKVPRLLFPQTPAEWGNPQARRLPCISTATLEELNTFTYTSQLPTNCSVGKVLPCPALFHVHNWRPFCLSFSTASTWGT